MSCYFRLSPVFFQVAFLSVCSQLWRRKNPFPRPLFSITSQLWTRCPRLDITSSRDLCPLRLGSCGTSHPFWFCARPLCRHPNSGAATFPTVDCSLQCFHCQGGSWQIRTSGGREITFRTSSLPRASEVAGGPVVEAGQVFTSSPSLHKENTWDCFAIRMWQKSARGFREW